MCRKTLCHNMHHDVRVPMALPDEHGCELAYANPLRTVHHRCEIARSLPCVPHLRLSVDETRPTAASCAYHSCCIQWVKVERCDAHAHAADVPVEKCARFVLEHRHYRLKKFWPPPPPPPPVPSQQTARHPRYQHVCPLDHDDERWNGGAYRYDHPYYEATWREDLRELPRIEYEYGEERGGSGAAAAARERALFLAAERLHALLADVALREAAVRDLEAHDEAARAVRTRLYSTLPRPDDGPPPDPREPAVVLPPLRADAPELNYFAARGRLREALKLLIHQRAVVCGFLHGARFGLLPDSSCTPS